MITNRRDIRAIVSRTHMRSRTCAASRALYVRPTLLADAPGDQAETDTCRQDDIRRGAGCSDRIGRPAATQAWKWACFTQLI